jgi:hypothetical protein
MKQYSLCQKCVTAVSRKPRVRYFSKPPVPYIHLLQVSRFFNSWLLHLFRAQSVLNPCLHKPKREKQCECQFEMKYAFTIHKMYNSHYGIYFKNTSTVFFKTSPSVRLYTHILYNSSLIIHNKNKVNQKDQYRATVNIWELSKLNIILRECMSNVKTDSTVQSSVILSASSLFSRTCGIADSTAEK